MNVWIVIPAHGREPVSRVAFAGIRWTLDQLDTRGITAEALVIADDGNIAIAAEHGLRTLRAPNSPLGRKWNDGYEHACQSGASHVMPCGSDDWIHPDFVATMLEHSQPDAVTVCRLSSAVSPDGRELASIRVPYEGGDGVRLFPVNLLKAVNYRPAAEKRDRAIDGSVQDRLAKRGRLVWAYSRDLGHWQIVDFKTQHNLTAYDRLRDAYAERVDRNPWPALERHYPSDLVQAARRLYT